MRLGVEVILLGEGMNSLDNGFALWGTGSRTKLCSYARYGKLLLAVETSMTGLDTFNNLNVL